MFNFLYCLPWETISLSTSNPFYASLSPLDVVLYQNYHTYAWYVTRE